MSLLQRNELRIVLNPQQINLTLRRNSWRGVDMQQLTLPCIPTANAGAIIPPPSRRGLGGGDQLAEVDICNPVNFHHHPPAPSLKEGELKSTTLPTGPAPWSAPLAVLEQLIKQEPWSSSGNVTAILSNHFTRYMLVPWSEMLLRGDEQHTYLQHLFNETYGELATRYELRLSPAAPGKPRIASAINNTLLEQLRTTITNAGLRLDSIQPWLMQSFNEQRRRIAREGGWFVTVEHGVLGILGISDNRWQLVCTLRCGPRWQHDLHTWLERLYLSGDADNIPKVLHCCSADPQQVAPAFTGDWRVIHLETTGSNTATDTGAAVAETMTTAD